MVKEKTSGRAKEVLTSGGPELGREGASTENSESEG